MTLWEAKDKIEKGEAGEFGDIPVAHERLKYFEIGLYFHMLANEIRNTPWPLGYRTKALELEKRAWNLGNSFRKEDKNVRS